MNLVLDNKLTNSFFEKVKERAFCGSSQSEHIIVYGHNNVAYQCSDGKLYKVKPNPTPTVPSVYGDSEDKVYECFDGYFYEVKGE